MQSNILNQGHETTQTAGARSRDVVIERSDLEADLAVTLKEDLDPNQVLSMLCTAMVGLAVTYHVHSSRLDRILCASDRINFVHQYHRTGTPFDISTQISVFLFRFNKLLLGRRRQRSTNGNVSANTDLGSSNPHNVNMTTIPYMAHQLRERQPGHGAMPHLRRRGIFDSHAGKEQRLLGARMRKYLPPGSTSANYYHK